MTSTRRPWASPAEQVWSEIWEAIGPHARWRRRDRQGDLVGRLDAAAGDRGPSPQERYFTFTYSPIIGSDRRGLRRSSARSIETTERVISERRRLHLHAVASATMETRTVDDAVSRCYFGVCRPSPPTYRSSRHTSS